jgi:mannose-6-phosphate isomerase-like protein (cupin superfamily)
MNRFIVGVLAAVFIVWQAVAISQSGAPPQFGQPGAAPQIAFDIAKTDVDTLLKNAPPAVDQQLRVVDMGKYNLGVGIVHRVATKDKPGDPISGPYHDYTAEVYIILSGGGILTTGGTMAEKKPGSNVNILNGPGGNGTAGQGAYSRRVGPGDIIIIPPGVLHAFSQITDQVTYLSVRPDPDRVLPGGYVNPLLVKNPLPPATK